jgi:hypothetical protein
LGARLQGDADAELLRALVADVRMNVMRRQTALVGLAKTDAGASP